MPGIFKCVMDKNNGLMTKRRLDKKPDETQREFLRWVELFRKEQATARYARRNETLTYFQRVAKGEVAPKQIYGRIPKIRHKTKEMI